jgi:predicted metal-binding protein
MMTIPKAASAIKAIDVLMPGWNQLVMICQACEKRSKAPKKFGAKKVAHALSSALRRARQPKTRIVQTTCMGLCPKRAVAVAAGAPDGTVQVIAWRKFDDANAALQALLAAAVGANPLSPTHQEQQ